MRHSPFLNILGTLLAASLSACNFPLPTATPGNSSDNVATSVAATLTAEAPASPPTPSPALSAGPGSVSGTLCYPSEPPLPNMRLYFVETGTQAVATQEHTDGSVVYTIDLAPGTYIAFAWLLDGGLGGSYSQAVPCGLSVACSDHSLIAFDVPAGGSVTGIDICDWYEQSAVPTPPGGPPAMATSPPLAQNPTLTATPPPGGVSLNCDGTYQRVRITDQGAAGKTISVDNWSGNAWNNVWNLASGDPMLRQLTDDAGAYSFGGCMQLVVVPFRHSNPQLWFELSVHVWNGAGMTQVYANEGYYGEWQKNGAKLVFKKASELGGSPLGPCEWVTLEHTWNGSAFQQTGSVVEPVPGCP